MAKEDYIIIDEPNFEKARKQIDKAYNSSKKTAVIAKDDEFNRKIIEKTRVDIIFGFESENKNKKDRLKQRESGVNQVLCKLMKENDKTAGINFSEIAKLKEKPLSSYIGKLKQNIALFSKYKTKVILLNTKGKNKHDLMAFLLSLGMPTSMAKFAIDNRINL
jgi:RNase P/RNase MRP subunit p30